MKAEKMVHILLDNYLVFQINKKELIEANRSDFYLKKKTS